MDTEVLKDNKKKMLSNDKLVVEGKEFVPNELNAKHQSHAYDVEKINWDNNMPQMQQTNPMLEKGSKFISYSTKIQSVSLAKSVLDAVAANLASDQSLHLTYYYRIRKPMSHKGAFVEYINDDREWGAGCYMLEALREEEPMTAFSSSLDG